MSSESRPQVVRDAGVPVASDQSLVAESSAGAEQASGVSTPSSQPHGKAVPVAAEHEASPPELRFAADNHDNIIKGIRAELIPGGGSMRIRLDPPQLGALHVTVQVVDGVVTAAFETTSEEATRLLGHSLNHLKTLLESHGVSVDRLQVQQSLPGEPPERGKSGDGQQHRDQPSHGHDDPARQEQQRREMLRRMWRRLSGAGDPLDVTG